MINATLTLTYRSVIGRTRYGGSTKNIILFVDDKGNKYTCAIEDSDMVKYKTGSKYEVTARIIKYVTEAGIEMYSLVNAKFEPAAI